MSIVNKISLLFIEYYGIHAFASYHIIIILFCYKYINCNKYKIIDIILQMTVVNSYSMI